MTGFKTTLLAATALTILTGAALAGDGNKAFVHQGEGDRLGVAVDNNNALVIQTGKLNEAGSKDENLLQNGRYSNIEITQSGNENDVGVTPTGVAQFGLRNNLEVTQTSNKNVVGEVIQDGQAQGDQTQGWIRNELTISQGGSGENKVLQVRQAHTVDGKKNSATVNQTGTLNEVTVLTQTGAGNAMTVTQSGKSGLVDHRQAGIGNTNRVTQSGTSNDTQSSTVGDGNTTNITQAGKSNFADAFVGVEGMASNRNTVTIGQGGSSLGDVARVDLLSSDGNTVNLGQNGANNATVNLTRGGLNNLTINQNTAGGSRTSTASVTGTDSSSNVLLATQVGASTLSLTLTESNGNNVEAEQTGKNTATLSFDRSSDNGVKIIQVGSTSAGSTATVTASNATHNDFSITQGFGTGHTATITVENGDYNKLGVLQLGTSNKVTALLKGDDNNSVNSPNFTVASDEAYNFGSVIAGKGLLAQLGDFNTVNLTISGNKNAIGAMQFGDNNTINATIGGNSNTAYVAQLSDGNIATFQQNGNFNNLGIVQGGR